MNERDDAADAARYRYLRARMRQQRTHTAHVFITLPALEAARPGSLPDRLDAAVDQQLREAAYQNALHETA